MADYTVLYNPLAGNGRGYAQAQELRALYPDSELDFVDMTEIQDYQEFFDTLPMGEAVIICGGDGTINRFINDSNAAGEKREILYYATGSGNDFLRDVGKKRGEAPFIINDYIKDLPLVTVGGKSYRFLNGVGYGIDGYCCEEGDRLRETSDKPVNYTAIAIKGLLFHYKTTCAEVTVDGVTHKYKNVWLAPTMNGRYYGGGMMPTPDQNRLDDERKVSVMVFHHPGKLKTLMVFPSIFKGEHVKHKSMVEVLTGRNIEVKFSRPTPLQIDGETISGVTGYTVSSGEAAIEREKEGIA